MGVNQKFQSGFVLFDVCYEDGTRTSNRKVLASELGGLNGDAAARAFVDMQDLMIGSGMPRGCIKTILQSQKIIKLMDWARSHCAP